MTKQRDKTSEINWHDLRDRLQRLSEEWGLQTGTESLQQQWMRLYGFFQNSTEGMLLINQLGEVIMANRACEQLFRKKQHELLQSSLYDLLPLTDISVQREPRIWLEAAASMGLYTTGDSMRNRRSYAIRQVALFEAGEELFFQVYVKEVTDLVRQSEFEADQLAMLLQMLAHSREPFILLDPSLTIFEFNLAAARMMHAITGRNMQKGQSYLDYATPGRAKEKGWEIFREVLSGLLVERELKVPSPMGAGSAHWLLTYQPLYDAYGEMAGVFIAGRDQTLERQWLGALAEHTQRLSLWEQQTQLAICALGSDFKIKYAGGALAHWLGAAGHRLEGASFRRYLPARSQLLHKLEAHFADQKEQTFAAIWELVGVDKQRLRVKVRASIWENQEAPSTYLLELARADENDAKYRMNMALELLASAIFDNPVQTFLLFDEFGQALPNVGGFSQVLPKLADQQQHLRQVLKLLGKQADYLLQQWEASGKRPMPFVSKQNELLQHWALAEKSDESGIAVIILALLDVSTSKTLPPLERELVRLKEKVKGLESKQNGLQTALGLMQEVFDSVVWDFSVETHRFHFHTVALRMLFGQKATEMDAKVLEDYLHPVDARAFTSVLSQPPANDEVVRGWLRVRNKEDAFDQWHYNVWFDENQQHWKGIWYRPVQTEGNLSLEHFLGFSRFLDDIGWGALVLNRQMQLEHASTLAIDWLQLPAGWEMQVFDQLDAVKQTRLAAEACGFREAGSLFEFEYFNAYTQRWLFVWIYTTQSIRAIYLQIMK